MKKIKLFEDYNEEVQDELPVGTKVKTDMGLKRTGVVIPRFNWKEADDGTYSEPKPDAVAVQWDNGEKGFSTISNLIIIDEQGKETPLGKVVSDEEIEASYSDWTISEKEFKMDSDSSGMIVLERPYDENCDECETQKVDYFTIYDDGKIAFDNWYPEFLYKKLVDFIKSKKGSVSKNENKKEIKNIKYLKIFEEYDVKDDECSKHAKDFAQWIFLQDSGKNWDIAAKFISGRVSVDEVYNLYLENKQQ